MTDFFLQIPGAIECNESCLTVWHSERQGNNSIGNNKKLAVKSVSISICCEAAARRPHEQTPGRCKL